jgi:hypothetical protein
MPTFPRAWFDAGVMTPESAADFARYSAGAPQFPERHWKWLAFRDFTDEREALTASECRAAFHLGESEPDANLGTAIMCRVLYERACPADVRRLAEASARPAVRRAAHVTA